jgi:hypothetical protein
MAFGAGCFYLFFGLGGGSCWRGPVDIGEGIIRALETSTVLLFFLMNKN